MRAALAWLALVGTVALALLPFIVPPYYVGLMIPFFGYAIALLGFNLLFGYAGLLSFGHAMFLGVGAYGAAVMAGVLGIKSFELVLVAVMLASAAIALPIGLLCVRYIGIFFGMLTLAFGMLFHSFLFKFYYLTGGDSGMRVPRMNILGLEFANYNKIEFLAGPVLLLLPWLLIIAGFADVANSAFAVRPAPSRPSATMRARPNISACTCTAFALRPSLSRRHSAPSVARFSAFASGLPIPSSSTGRSPASSCSWRCWAALPISSALLSARSPTPCCRISCSRSRNIGASCSA